jgi:hypothetical protein
MIQNSILVLQGQFDDNILVNDNKIDSCISKRERGTLP